MFASPPKTFAVRNLSELSSVAQALTQICVSSPSVILFFGSVGAGKTTLIQSLMLALGSREVSSPTYTLHQTYRFAEKHAEHLDLYRIESADDLETTGVWDILSSPSHLVLVEWADKLPADFIAPGRQVIRVRIEVMADNQRRVSISP